MTKREQIIAAALVVALLGSVGFMAAYALHAGMQTQGAALLVAACAFALASFGYGAWIIPDERVVDRIDEYPCDAADRTAALAVFVHGEREIARNGFLLKMFAGALGAFAAALLFPFRSLGPAPGNTLFTTKWKRGDRLVRADGSVVLKDALNIDSIETVYPEGAAGDAASQTVLIRLPMGAAGTADGYIAYSKLCTHAGCPVALYRARERQLLCPCHQSVFDVLDEGKVLSGPADHALPRLPLETDKHGYLRASNGYAVPVGPGFWERG